MFRKLNELSWKLLPLRKSFIDRSPPEETLVRSILSAFSLGFVVPSLVRGISTMIDSPEFVNLNVIARLEFMRVEVEVNSTVSNVYVMFRPKASKNLRFDYYALL